MPVARRARADPRRDRAARRRWRHRDAHTTLPYVPGYLGFRECPALVAAWALLTARPALIMVDGQGQAHPRRCGVATQLGVLLDVATIGVAKSLLCGSVKGEPARSPVIAHS